MDITYYSQEPNPRLWGPALSGSAIHQQLKPKFRRFATGELLAHLAITLNKVKRIAVSKVNFALVNVTTTFNKFSYGYLGVPPEAAWPPNHTLMFTFALTEQDYDDQTEVAYRWASTNGLVVWGPEAGSPRYVTIGLSVTQAYRMKLSSIMTFETEYLYNVLGVALKNLVTKNHLSLFSKDSWEEFYSFQPEQYTSKYSGRGILALMRTVPYPYWIFHKELWMVAPNIFNPKMISDITADWFFRNVPEAFARSTSSEWSRKAIFGVGTNSKLGISSHVMKSVLKFMQSVKSSELIETDVSASLVPLILHGMIYNGDNRITADQSDVPSITKMFGETDVNWGTMFSQPSIVADRIIRSDMQFADSLLNIVDID